ncbi:MAG TPA: MFS transporter [Polyangiales bacterium]|nr:MFS transporter [Polyangiales bacterium]
MGRLFTLLALYFAQGLPFGFQVTALPLLLRERGVSLEAIGFAGVLAAPWMAKALWAPWVDRYGHLGFGRRKSWIVPMQLCLVICALIASRNERLEVLLVLVFVMNAFAATMDIAVDGLAVSWIRPSELGIANAFQVVGYKLGMLTGGGLLLWASARIGHRGVFEAMAALLVLVLFVALSIRENRPTAVGSTDSNAPVVSLREIWLLLRAALRERSTLPLLAVIVTYKLGESLADGMWKPMLFDKGFDKGDIGLWNGTYGMIASFAGSLLAGVWTRARPLQVALIGIALFRAAGVGAEWWISVVNASARDVIVVTCIEHFLGGALTTVVFALMMRHTRREIGGTHFTLLASLEVLGKSLLGAWSGVIATGIGYSGLFATATVLSIGFAALAAWARAPLTAAEPIAAEPA